VLPIESMKPLLSDAPLLATSPLFSALQINHCFSPTERIPAAVALLSKAFETDPVITYFLSSLNLDQRLAYIAAYFRSLLTAAGLNGASFDEVGDWSCCAVWVPPGRHVDNPLTLFQSGLLGMLWKLGLGGCWVC
jgi:hypothetical protein